METLTNAEMEQMLRAHGYDMSSTLVYYFIDYYEDGGCQIYDEIELMLDDDFSFDGATVLGKCIPNEL